MIDKIANSLRKLRVFSWVMATFACVKLSEALSWTYSLDLNNLTMDATLLVTAILTALVGLVKITYTFAVHKTPRNKITG